MFQDTGEVEFEYALKDGKRHGFECHFWRGVLTFVGPFVDGVAHGVAKQWDEQGLLGTYRLNRGSGLDLWRQRRQDGTLYLSEAAVIKDGHFTYQCSLDENQRAVFSERQMSGLCGHEIVRFWNVAGRLDRGYPKYSISGKPVTKRQYLAAAKTDPTVPPFRIEDNRPERAFPPVIAMHLQPPRGATRR